MRPQRAKLDLSSPIGALDLGASPVEEMRMRGDHRRQAPEWSAVCPGAMRPVVVDQPLGFAHELLELGPF